MAIQMRRGKKADFDPNKMLAGEWAVAIDAETENQIVWMCFAPGVVKRMGTYEDFQAQIQEISGDIINQFKQELTEAQVQLQNKTETYIQGKVDDDWVPELQALVTQAQTSEKNASDSASAAKTSENAAKTAQTAAETARTGAETAQKASETARDAAKTAQAGAETAKAGADASKTAAAKSATEAENWKKLAESYAHGETGVRDNEDTDNGLYYLEQTRNAANSITNALKPKGDIKFAELADLSPSMGDYYSVSDDFTSDARFSDGGDKYYPAGTDIWYTDAGKWNPSQGSGVAGIKGSSESAYRKGLVNITKGNIGLDKVDNTADSDKIVASAGKLTTPRNINGVKFDGTQDITVRDNLKMPISNNVTGGTDFNTLTQPGFYMRQGTNTNAPTTGDSHYHILVLKLGTVTVTNDSPTYIRQIAYDIRSTAVWTRALVNSQWKAWERVYTTGNKPSSADVGAVSKSGDTMTGDLTLSGDARQIKYASGARTGSPIKMYKGDTNGSGLVIGDGGRTIIGGGEAAENLRTALGTTTADESAEELHLANDGTVNVWTNCQNIAARKHFTFGTDGKFTADSYAGKTSDTTADFTSDDVADGTASLAWTKVDKLTSGMSIRNIFNRVSTMFKNIRYLYKMLGTTDISKIGDGTVTGILNELNGNTSVPISFDETKARIYSRSFCKIIANKYLVLFVSFTSNVDIKSGETVFAINSNYTNQRRIDIYLYGINQHRTDDNRAQCALLLHDYTVSQTNFYLNTYMIPKDSVLYGYAFYDIS